MRAENTSSYILLRYHIDFMISKNNETVFGTDSEQESRSDFWKGEGFGRIFE